MTQEKTWPDTVVVSGHTAKLTGAFWWIVADKETGLPVTHEGIEFYSDKEDAEEVAEIINNARPIEMLTKAAIDTLDKKLDLVYVSYDDRLTDDQVSKLLEGDIEGVWDSTSEWESEAQHYSIQHLWEEALSSFDQIERERLEESSEAYEAFQSECWERDESDWFDQLCRNTPGVMIRYYLTDKDGDEVEIEGYTTDLTVEEQAQTIAEAAGISYDENKQTLHEIVVNASYGGMLCVLHCSDITDVTEIDTGGRGHGGEVIFTDPYLLVYDGLNGSGMDGQVTGTVRIKITEGTMRHDTGSYSWSDGIAGVVHSAYDTPAEFISHKDVNNDDKENA